MRLPIVLLICNLLAGAILDIRHGLSPAERTLTRHLERQAPGELLAAQELQSGRPHAAGWSLVCVRGPFEGSFNGHARGASPRAHAAVVTKALDRINAELARHDPVNGEGEWEIIFGSTRSVDKFVIDAHQVSFEPPPVKCVPYEDAAFTRAELSDYPFGTGITLTDRSDSGHRLSTN